MANQPGGPTAGALYKEAYQRQKEERAAKPLTASAGVGQLARPKPPAEAAPPPVGSVPEVEAREKEAPRATSHQGCVDQLFKSRNRCRGCNRGWEPATGEPKPGNVPRYEPRNGVIVHCPGHSKLLTERVEPEPLGLDGVDPYGFRETCRSVPDDE